MFTARHHQKYRRLGDRCSNILATRLRLGWCPTLPPEDVPVVRHPRQSHTFSFTAPHTCTKWHDSHLPQLCIVWPHVVKTAVTRRQKDLRNNKEWEKVQQVPTEKPTWSYNKTAADGFRKELEDICNTKDDFIVTKKNFPVGSVIQYDAERHSRLNVTNDVWERFSPG
ncbi:ST8SIA1 [Branchiostoma lanceolatum]|uniref:ST8SIA1 protein n=1 Tax=Branchiostoma lanceolatum TaxID=7740 RepID=A0A8J9YZ44_BRALA|nr:ST8SIA1 [Branchiostoma lanceolatum]